VALDRNTRWRRVVRWAGAIIPILIFGGLVWVWVFHETHRQNKWIATASLGLAAYAAFLVWVLFGSNWRARARWSVFVGTIALVIFCRFCLRISGVTGDLVPIAEWRWKQPRVVSVERSAGGEAADSARLTNSYPQFLGPSRDGKLTGPSLERDWKKSPPQELWRHAVGSAWSGFAIKGNRAITQEQRGEEEMIICYDVMSGSELWSHADKSRYATTIAGEGPRATPTIASNRVYSLGGAGMLNCLDLGTGKRIWGKDTLAAPGAKLPEWGVACSPLVNGRAVIVTVGGRGHALVAYDRDSGAVLWAGGQDETHWSSPVRATLAGVPQILVFSENVSSYDEQTGKTLWQYPWRNSYPHVTVPLVLASNRVLVSQGYGTGSELLEVSQSGRHWRAQRIWKSIRMKSKFANLIHVGGYVYGLDDGALACIDANTGDLKWKGDRYGHGQMILVGDLLLLTAENGDIVLLEPNSIEQRELARFKVFNAKTWNPPALAGDLLVVRNDREAACLRLPVVR
jgi:outer membrane protein assembly factor BamB